MGHFIEIANVDLDLIKSKVVEHGELSVAEPRKVMSIEVWKEDDKSIIKLPEETHSYEISNLIGWLSDIGDCHGWWLGREKYYFEMDKENSWGDTLLGISKFNQKVKLYLPEIILAKVDTGLMHYVDEPAVPAREPDIVFEYISEDLGISMNPKLEEFSPLSKIPHMATEPGQGGAGCLTMISAGGLWFAIDQMSNWMG